MKYVLLIIGLCLLGTGGFLLAQEARLAKQSKLPKKCSTKKNRRNNVEMTLDVARVNVAGIGMNLAVSLTNKSQKVVKYGPTDGSYRDFIINVKDLGGKAVPLTRFGKKWLARKRKHGFKKFNPKPIKPGETATITFNLSLLFDLTLPGTYRVTVATEVYPLTSAAFTINVEEVEFKVIEPSIIPVKTVARDTGQQKKANGKKK
ncbi:MAG: hypothetical protein K8S55_08870 [Phycisphaerae bacterium]|nr:hypothetical protein [Phycisphaerae bacterium]